MRTLHHAWTRRADGDFAGDQPPPWGPAPQPWTTLRQVHGARVVVVARPGEHTGSEADALVTATPGCTLAVRTADCAPVVLAGAGTLGLVHAGWRGLVEGVVGRAAEAMAALGDPPVHAVLGPCIRAGCYEFTGPELDSLADRFGDGVRGTTMWGTPALDLAAAVRAACADSGVDDLDDAGACTACDDRWFSHRARAEPQRFATLAWIEESA